MNAQNIAGDELLHYGVLGMKWGVHRAISKSDANQRLQKKALNYDKKSANLRKKSEKLHSEYDLERSNKAARKAAKYDKKAAIVRKKALKETNDFKKVLAEKKASKLEYKSAKKQIVANRISKTSGYGMEAMKYSIKSDKVAAKAAKARMKIASNEAYINATKRKISSLSEEDLRNGYEFVKRLSE